MERTVDGKAYFDLQDRFEKANNSIIQVVKANDGLSRRICELEEENAKLKAENERLMAYRVEITVKPNEDNEYWCPKCGEQIVGYYAIYCEYCGQCVELEDNHDKN